MYENLTNYLQFICCTPHESGSEVQQISEQTASARFKYQENCTAPPALNQQLVLPAENCAHMCALGHVKTLSKYQGKKDSIV